MLGDFIEAKSGEWAGLTARLATLEAKDPRFAPARAAAEAAIAAADFDRGDTVLAGVAKLQREASTLTEARQQARLSEVRADALLLKCDAEGAAAELEAAAGLLLPFAPEEAALLRHIGSGRLYEHGRHLGDTGVARAIELLRRNEPIRTLAAHPEEWVQTQVCLGLALSDEARRHEGADGAALLAEAATAYRATLQVFTRARPKDWAMAQISLGFALLGQAERIEAAATLLAEAASAFGAALEVRSRFALPPETLFDIGHALLHWAMDQDRPAEVFAEFGAGAPRVAGGHPSRREPGWLGGDPKQPRSGACRAGQAN